MAADNQMREEQNENVHPDWTVSVRYHMERILEEHDKRYSLQFDSQRREIANTLAALQQGRTNIVGIVGCVVGPLGLLTAIATLIFYHK